VAYADFVGIERRDHWSGKLRQANSGSAICRGFAYLGRDLLDAALRVVQVKEGFESLRLLQRVNVAALQVLDLAAPPAPRHR
jgi:hypothetical protein